MFNKSFIKPNEKISIYQNILSPCFNSKTSIPPSNYALLNEADISSTCAIGHSTELNERNLCEQKMI